MTNKINQTGIDHAVNIAATAGIVTSIHSVFDKCKKVKSIVGNLYPETYGTDKRIYIKVKNYSGGVFHLTSESMKADFAEFTRKRWIREGIRSGVLGALIISAAIAWHGLDVSDKIAKWWNGK